MFGSKERIEVEQQNEKGRINFIYELYYSRIIKTQIKEAMERLHEISGLKLPMPTLELYDFPGNRATAQLYNSRKNADYELIVWDIKAALNHLDTIPHEMYHEAQHEYRKRNGDGDSETQYLINADFKGKAAVNKASALWNGVNEAGAYIFGYGEMYKKEGLQGKELGIKVLQEIVKWSGTTIGLSSNEVLDLFFTEKGIESVSQVSQQIETVRIETTPITAAIVLWQNDFDADKAAKYLLQDPGKTIEEITMMGREKVTEILKNVENIISKA